MHHPLRSVPCRHRPSFLGPIFFPSESTPVLTTPVTSDTLMKGSERYLDED